VIISCQSGVAIAQDSTDREDFPLNFPMVISYQNNSAKLSHINRLRLQILADFMNENSDVKIVIEGHVCCGPAPRMSKKRAKSVYKMLKKYGAPKDQMTYVGKSFDEPIVLKERSEQDKDLNRRVEIELVTK
jgi:outer membrane protein OmpA-like peptidoglycan-associated protein